MRRGDGETIRAALVFGDLHDPASAVARAAADRRGYHILEDLNVRPSVTYLAKVQHREVETPAAPSGAEH